MQLSPEQFHTLFDRAAQPVLLVQDGVITQCSSRAEGLIAPGSPIRELLPPDAVLQELITAAPRVLPLRLRREAMALPLPAPARRMTAELASGLLGAGEDKRQRKVIFLDGTSVQVDPSGLVKGASKL